MTDIGIFRGHAFRTGFIVLEIVRSKHHLLIQHGFCGYTVVYVTSNFWYSTLGTQKLLYIPYYIIILQLSTQICSSFSIFFHVVYYAIILLQKICHIMRKIQLKYFYTFCIATRYYIHKVANRIFNVFI